MKLGDLRKVVDNEEIVRITVKALDGHDAEVNSVKSGDNLFFTVDDTIDGLEVSHLAAENGNRGKSASLQYDVENKNAVLRIDLSCTMEDLENYNWQDIFNNQAIQEKATFSAADVKPGK